MHLTIRRHLIPTVLLGTALAGGLLVAPAATAGPAVSIRKISNTKVAYGKKATIRPLVRAAARTRVTSKRLTVRKGSKVVARNRTSVRLRAGKYKVTTQVRFRVRSSKVVRSRVTKNVLAVPAYTSTPVSCLASNVRVDMGTTLDLACTSRAFDGVHRFFDVTPFVGDEIDAWNAQWSHLAGIAPAPAEGDMLALTLTPAFDLYQRRTVTVRRTVTRWSGIKSTRRTQPLKVTERPRPKRTSPYPSGECPDWAPIKGNGDSMIYHVPGGRWYDVTIAEDCFATEGAARAAGYRASRNG